MEKLGRKLSDVADLYDRLQFAGVKLHAVKLGEVTTLHVGLMGTMAQLYLSDLRDKTRRGQLGRALARSLHSAGSSWPLCRSSSPLRQSSSSLSFIRLT